jgi:hypothetical protein
MPTNAPTVYKKATEDMDVKMPTHASSLEDQIIQAEDVDVENTTGAKNAEEESEYYDEEEEEEDEESEEEEPEEEEERPEPKKEPARLDHAKSIEALKASFEPVNQKLESNPTPAWKQPEGRSGLGGKKEEKQEAARYWGQAEPGPAIRPSQKQREIEELKNSYLPLQKNKATLAVGDTAILKENTQAGGHHLQAGAVCEVLRMEEGDVVVRIRGGVKARLRPHQLEKVQDSSAPVQDEQPRGISSMKTQADPAAMPTQSAADRGKQAEQNKNRRRCCSIQ